MRAIRRIGETQYFRAKYAVNNGKVRTFLSRRALGPRRASRRLRPRNADTVTAWTTSRPSAPGSCSSRARSRRGALREQAQRAHLRPRRSAVPRRRGRRLGHLPAARRLDRDRDPRRDRRADRDPLRRRPLDRLAALPRLGRADQPARHRRHVRHRGRRGARRALRASASDWTAAGLLGAAVAPTDPAVMFSVLGDREIGGRSGTILQGESGANDPVGIALMIGMIELADAPRRQRLDRGARVLRRRWRSGSPSASPAGCCSASGCKRVSLPSSGLYTLRTLAGAGVIYGVAAVAGGSGFLAVFVAGPARRRRPRAVQGRERGVPRRALVARRDRRVRRARADDLDLERSAATCGSTGCCSRRCSRS